MRLKISLDKIKKDLVKLNQFEVIIFGSYAKGKFTSRSDIDIAAITRESNPEKNKKIWVSLLKIPSLYHLNIFELFPLNLKADIIDNHIVLFGDKLEISEYFYHFRKLWKDQKYRYYDNQFSSFKEKMNALLSKKTADQ